MAMLAVIAPRLAGRRALVTGGARGLGLAAAQRLAADGAAVALLDVDAEAVTAAAAALAATGARAIAVVADVTDGASVRRAVDEAAAELGGLDILVNNAGVVRDRPLAEMTDEDWDVVLDVDLRGYFVCCRAALPHLRESPAGRIVCVSSRAHMGNPGQANYSAAKAGVIGLTRALSLELGRDGITVNAVAPGMIDTQLVRAHPKAEQIVERAVRVTPLGRIGRPDEVASAIAFLASADASYVTGELLHVTGGRR